MAGPLGQSLRPCFVGVVWWLWRRRLRRLPYGVAELSVTDDEAEDGEVFCPRCEGPVLEFLWVVRNDWYCSQACGVLTQRFLYSEEAPAQTSAML